MDETECQNCGMIDVPLLRNHCDGCICLQCKRTAEESSCSMNEAGWCNACEAEFQVEFLGVED